MKLIGIILIAIIPGILGLLKYYSIKQEYKNLCELIEFITQIRQAVRYSRVGIKNIFYAMRAEGKFIQFIGIESHENPYTDISSAVNDLKVDKAALNYVLSCIKKITVCDSTSAIEELEMCISQLNTIEKAVLIDSKNKSSMYLKLGLLGSAFVLIILI